MSKEIPICSHCGTVIIPDAGSNTYCSECIASTEDIARLRHELLLEHAEKMIEIRRRRMERVSVSLTPLVALKKWLSLMNRVFIGLFFVLINLKLNRFRIRLFTKFFLPSEKPEAMAYQRNNLLTSFHLTGSSKQLAAWLNLSAMRVIELFWRQISKPCKTTHYKMKRVLI